MENMISIHGYKMEVNATIQIVNKIQNSFKVLSKELQDEFLSKCSACKSLDDLVEKIPIFAYEEIGKSLEVAVGYLIKANIYDYSVERLYNEFGDEYFNFMDLYNEGYLNKYLEIIATKEQLEEYRKMQRIGNSRFEGGGFGIAGALKGAAKAGALNLGLSGIRGIIASVGSTMDNTKISRLKKKMFEDVTQLMDVGKDVFLCCYKVSHLVTRIYETMGLIEPLEWEPEKAKAICDNAIRYAETDNQKVEMIMEALNACPYEWCCYEALFAIYSEYDHEVAMAANYFGLYDELYEYFSMNIIDVYILCEEFNQSIDDYVSIMEFWEEYKAINEGLVSDKLIDQSGNLIKMIFEDFNDDYCYDLIEKTLNYFKIKFEIVDKVSCSSMKDIQDVFIDYEKHYQNSNAKCVYDYVMLNGNKGKWDKFVIKVSTEHLHPLCGPLANLIKNDKDNLIQNALITYYYTDKTSKKAIGFLLSDRRLYIHTEKDDDYKIDVEKIEKIQITQEADKYYFEVSVNNDSQLIKVLLQDYKLEYNLNEFMGRTISSWKRSQVDKKIIETWKRLCNTDNNDFNQAFELFSKIDSKNSNDQLNTVKKEIAKYLSDVKTLELEQEWEIILADKNFKETDINKYKAKVDDCVYLTNEAHNLFYAKINDARSIIQEKDLNVLLSTHPTFNPDIITRGNLEYAKEILGKTDGRSKKRVDIYPIVQYVSECDNALTKAKNYCEERMEVFSHLLAGIFLLVVGYVVLKLVANIIGNWLPAPGMLSIWFLFLIVFWKSIRKIFSLVGETFKEISRFHNRKKEISKYEILYKNDMIFISQGILIIFLVIFYIAAICIIVNLYVTIVALL